MTENEEFNGITEDDTVADNNDINTEDNTSFLVPDKEKNATENEEDMADATDTKVSTETVAYEADTGSKPSNCNVTEQYQQMQWAPSVAVVKDLEQVLAEEPVTPEKMYKKTIRGIFLILCLFTVLSFVAVLPTAIYSILSYTSTFPASEDLYYIFSFAIPQFLYPLITVIASVFMAVIAKRKIRNTVKIKNAPAVDVLLSIGIFLGIGTVGSYISEFITDFIIGLGIPVPDMEEFIPSPESPLQFCLYLVVVAVLPAICEEFVFRGVICGLIKEYNRTAAIILSAMAFSLVHATVQQIPFAFIMGLFLGYLYIKYDTLLIGIILHFINNFVSCIFTVMYERIPEETFTIIYTIYDITTVVLGIVCAVFFIIRIMKYRNQDKKDNISVLSGGKLWKATLASWAMWLFIAVYAFETAANIFLLSSY